MPHSDERKVMQWVLQSPKNKLTRFCQLKYLHGKRQWVAEIIGRWPDEEELKELVAAMNACIAHRLGQGGI